MEEWKYNRTDNNDQISPAAYGQPDAPPPPPPPEAAQSDSSETGSTPQKEKKKRKKWPIVAGSIAAVVLLLLLGLFLYVNSLLNLLNRTKIEGSPDESFSAFVGEEEFYDEPDTVEAMNSAVADFDAIREYDLAYSPKVRNILLIGSDSRTASFSGLADSVILVSINQESGKIHLSSLTRTMYVYIPGRDDFNMLNASYAWGGTEMLIDTIETNFRVKIDEHMAINFSNFEKVINIAGGVDITLTAEEAEYLHYESAGTYHMDGAQALAYSRLRHLDTDFMRTGRQRAVIEALVLKAGDMNISQLTQMVYEIFPNINTSMTNFEILGLIAQMGEIAGYDLSQTMLPLECSIVSNPFTTRMYVNHMEMYWFDYKENIELLWKFIHDKEEVKDVPTIPFER